jgi:hypothetical protein
MKPRGKTQSKTKVAGLTPIPAVRRAKPTPDAIRRWVQVHADKSGADLLEIRKRLVTSAERAALRKILSVRTTEYNRLSRVQTPRLVDRLAAIARGLKMPITTGAEFPTATLIEQQVIRDILLARQKRRK